MAAAVTECSRQNQQVCRTTSLALAEIGRRDTECVCSTRQQEPEVKEQLDQLLLSLSEQEQVMLISSGPHDGRQDKH